MADKKWLAWVGFVVVLPFAASAQDSSRKLISLPPLLGRWQCSNTASPVQATLDFRENGAFITRIPLGVFKGTWQWIVPGQRLSYALDGGPSVTILIRQYAPLQFQSSNVSTPNLIDTCRRISSEACVKGDCHSGPGTIYDLRADMLTMGSFVSGKLEGPVTTLQNSGSDLIKVEMAGPAGGPARITITSDSPFKHNVTTGNMDSSGQINGPCRMEFFSASKRSAMALEGSCANSFPTTAVYFMKDAEGKQYRIAITDFSVSPWPAILTTPDGSQIQGSYNAGVFQNTPSGSPVICRLQAPEYVLGCE